jgi:hypothetical protein
MQKPCIIFAGFWIVAVLLVIVVFLNCYAFFASGKMPASPSGAAQ